MALQGLTNDELGLTLSSLPPHLSFLHLIFDPSVRPLPCLAYEFTPVVKGCHQPATTCLAHPENLPEPNGSKFRCPQEIGRAHV